ncbi:LOW QUALITY PROTEIN: hypothetical protein JCM19045_4809 [Bacillus sp. JCM 19045]|nr:LOW QUALITY PROTEIN: hypothetical protein JCM19045_4809 [Bacillus sp. JCM 19045]
MKILFAYNWQVRSEWLNWCETLSEAELLAPQVGGVGSIAKTMLHIIDVEWSWIRRIQGQSDEEYQLGSEDSLKQIIQLNHRYHNEVKAFVDAWEPEWRNGCTTMGIRLLDRWGEIMRHLIAHEIHHIGQLSVWAKQLGYEPISANVIGRNLLDK